MLNCVTPKEEQADYVNRYVEVLFMTQNIANTLYEMDNLEVLRGINSNSIDLIAADPLFNREVCITIV